MATIDEKFRNKKAALETDLPALQERILDIRAQIKALEKELEEKMALFGPMAIKLGGLFEVEDTGATVEKLLEAGGKAWREKNGVAEIPGE